MSAHTDVAEHSDTQVEPAQGRNLGTPESLDPPLLPTDDANEHHAIDAFFDLLESEWSD